MSSGLKYWSLAALLIIICLTARCDYYQVTIGDIGWTTGLRQSMNVSMDMSGSTIGVGTYQRFTEIKLNDVLLHERIAADNGTLDTSERIHAMAETLNPILITLTKPPGGQNYSLSVVERWPAIINAQRSIDYLGRSISDRDLLGNNFDFVGASYLWNKDLRVDRAASLLITNATFKVTANNATRAIYENRFLPSKFIDYRISSLSKGIATLRYRQASDHSVANEGIESYAGNFLISRHISMRESLWNSSENDTDWIGCPFGNPCSGIYDPRMKVSEAKVYGWR